MKPKGLAYGCGECKHFLHKSCAEMPQEIQHPYHPQHPLLLHYHEKGQSSFICDGCRIISSGFAFQCEHCKIKLDVGCALLTYGSSGQRSEECEIKTQIFHFSHCHRLHLFNKVKNEQYLLCRACLLMISGLGYGCLECKVYLHKSCAEMPRKLNHSYHPFHPLHAQMGEFAEERCAACKANARRGIVYNCSECDFTLHLFCAKVSRLLAPTLKHNRHKHSIYYFVGLSTLVKYRNRRDGNWDLTSYVCDVCGKSCDGPSYICLDCECVFHLECIPIPRVVFKRDSHMHSLTLREPLVAADDEDNSKEYYCFACERERNPKYHAYHCDQCPYEAHIECMVSEFVDDEYYNSAWTSNKVDEIKGATESPPIAEYALPQCRRQLEFVSQLCPSYLIRQIGDFRNNHIMIFREIYFLKQCYGCKTDFLGPAYTCEFCNINFHIVCAELPPKIRHTLHLLHPLKFFEVMSLDEYYICDGCATISRDCGYYRCEECSFILDIKCASIKDKCQLLEERHDNVMISHFSHQHKLLLANRLKAIRAECPICLKNISGPTYCCLRCQYFIHESCSKVERVIRQNPFHPQHPLEWTDSALKGRCRACNSTYEDAFVYHCSKCSFYIHYTCSKYLSSTLKYKNHEHNLFYFVAKDLSGQSSLDENVRRFPCKVCRKYCNESFYRCLDCDLNLHLKCMALPQKVEGSFHMHPLTLMDSVVQDYYDEQYCYDCEDLRNPNHAVYSCLERGEKCIYIAHIGCVLNEVRDSLKIFSSSIAYPWIKNSKIEFAETSWKKDWEVGHLTDIVKESKKETNRYNLDDYVSERWVVQTPLPTNLPPLIYGQAMISRKNNKKERETEKKKESFVIVEVDKENELLEQEMKSLKSS